MILTSGKRAFQIAARHHYGTFVSGDFSIFQTHSTQDSPPLQSMGVERKSGSGPAGRHLWEKSLFRRFLLASFWAYAHNSPLWLVRRLGIQESERRIVMSHGDGTGPVGMGPMTGRAAGYCAGYQAPGCANPAGGRGFWGCGRGRGRRNGLQATGLPRWARAGYGLPGVNGAAGAPAAESDEVETLHRQAQSLERSLGEIRTRIDLLESQRKGEI